MWRLSVLVLIATASAQIPSLGWCPDYQPMANFNINRFLGDWYESERYFTVSELGTRCVNTKYTSTPEGRILVSNEITNSLTGYKRVLDGALQMIGREGEGRMIVKYSSLPVPYDTEYSILDTDYDNYAVMWSCSGIGPVHIQNAWILTRERLAGIAPLQSAYMVLDRFKISRTFFVKTNQDDCTILPQPAMAAMDAKDVIEEEAEKSAVIIPVVEPKDVVPVEKKVDAEVKSEVPQIRSGASEMPEEPAKPAEMASMKPEKDLKETKAGMELQDKKQKEEKIEMPAPRDKTMEKDLPKQ